MMHRLIAEGPRKLEEGMRLGSRGALVDAIGRALSALVTRDARGFFEHCGYRAPAQTMTAALRGAYS
jgi:hypothetical protein